MSEIPAPLGQHPNASPPWPNESEPAPRRPNGEPLRVLVVEDDAMLALLYGEVLEGLGYQVCAIANRETEAVAAALHYRPDLMVVDQRLGVGSGVAAVETILETLTIPHVFVSGDPAPVRRLRPGAVVLRKPFHEGELAQALKQAMNLAGGSAPPSTDLNH